MRDMIYESGKRLYKRLPKKLQSKALTSSSRLLFQRHTRGLQPSQESIEWVSQHARPVSIVIPSYNDFPLLSTCLQSISDTCARFDYEVIVVDDFCEDENRERLKSLNNGRVRVIFREQRGGFAKAVNTGMRLAKYDILLLNSDIVAQPGWLEALQHSAYAIDPKIGLVSPKLVYPDGRIQYGGTYHAKVLAPQWFGHLFVGRAANEPVPNRPAYNRSISGACAYITRKAYAQLGDLDEEFWLGFEDVDYGLRAWQKGFRCYYQPGSMLIHHESASRGYSQGKRELASMRYFWRLWGDHFISTGLSLKDRKLTVDYVLSPKASSLWRSYIEAQVSSLKARGHKVNFYCVDDSNVDESVVSKLESRKSLIVCCDRGASQTVWLSSLRSAKPLYMLPDIESVAFPDDPSLQADIIAGYKPEFYFIAPSRWASDQLKAEAAWESARLVPAVLTKPLSLNGAVTGQRLLFITSNDKLVDRIDALAAEFGLRLETISPSEISLEYLSGLGADLPRVIISALSGSGSSLLDLSLLGTGIPLISYTNAKTRYELLDGYNTLQVEAGDIPAIRSALESIITDTTVAQELGANGIASQARYAGNRNTQAVEDLLFTIATEPF